MTNRPVLDAAGRPTVPLKSRQMVEYAPISFDGVPTRICNASSRTDAKDLIVALMRDSTRPGAMDAATKRSRGIGC